MALTEQHQCAFADGCLVGDGPIADAHLRKVKIGRFVLNALPGQVHVFLRAGQVVQVYIAHALGRHVSRN